GRGAGAGERRLAHPRDRAARGQTTGSRRGADRPGDRADARRPNARPAHASVRRRVMADTKPVAPAGAPSGRRTKIVATVGPASREPEVLRQLLDAGVDVFRLNFAHGTPEEQAEAVRRIRAASVEAGREVGIMGALPGPKLRLGE